MMCKVYVNTIHGETIPAGCYDTLESAYAVTLVYEYDIDTFTVCYMLNGSLQCDVVKAIKPCYTK